MRKWLHREVLPNKPVLFVPAYFAVAKTGTDSVPVLKTETDSVSVLKDK